MRHTKLVSLIAVLLAPVSANAYPEHECALAVTQNLYKKGYSANTHHAVDLVNQPSQSQFYFKWNPKDKWTSCNRGNDSILYCGSVARFKSECVTCSSLEILSTAGESFSAKQLGSKINTCSISPNPRVGSNYGREEQGYIFSIDFSATYLFEFNARGIGKRTFFLKDDQLGVETFALLGAPKF